MQYNESISAIFLTKPDDLTSPARLPEHKIYQLLTTIRIELNDSSEQLSMMLLRDDELHNELRCTF